MSNLELSLRRSYEVRQFIGTVKREKILYKRVEDKHGKKPVYTRSTKEVEEAGGYLVTFPRGHSIRVRDKATLQRLNFSESPEIIDMNTGEPIPRDMLASLLGSLLPTSNLAEGA
jgi:hypothetical protein